MWPDHCVVDTEGVKLHKDLVVDEQNDLVFKKGKFSQHDAYSGFGTENEDTGLVAKLKELNVKKVFVVGLAYDFCVGSTALDAAKNGFETYIIEEGTRSVAEPFEKSMDERIQK